MIGDDIWMIPLDRTSTKNFIMLFRYNYYYKYKTAFNIPIVSSNNVGEAALTRACYVLFFLLADKWSVRYHLYKKWGRLGIIGRYERKCALFI